MAAATTATANTVSQPLQLSSSDASAANGSTRRRAVKPSGKVTLTSLTENNVSAAFVDAIIRAESVEVAWNSEEDHQRCECGPRRHCELLLIYLLSGTEPTVLRQVVQGSIGRISGRCQQTQ